MSIKSEIDSDLKQAMLAGSKGVVTTLRGLKSVILYAEVAAGKREDGLSDQEIVGLLMKESKKRQESADLYKQGANDERAEAEIEEKRIIEKYLPAQIGDDELETIISEIIRETGASDIKQIGQVISVVKERTGGGADGSRIATMVKARLQ